MIYRTKREAEIATRCMFTKAAAAQHRIIPVHRDGVLIGWARQLVVGTRGAPGG